MKIIHILPTGNLQDIKQDIYMCLTHLVEKDPEYANFFRNTKGYKILDNSLIELGDAASLERVLQAAEKIRADEIILPDVFLDREGTLEAVFNSLDYLEDHQLIGKYKLMAVCQGSTPDEFERCFRTLETIPEIDVIGIPKVCAKLHPCGRPFFEGLWKYSKKQIHLLGLWYSWNELREYTDIDAIRSMDTCLLAFAVSNKLIPYKTIRPDGFTVSLEQKLNTKELVTALETLNIYIL